MDNVVHFAPFTAYTPRVDLYRIYREFTVNKMAPNSDNFIYKVVPFSPAGLRYSARCAHNNGNNDTTTNAKGGG